MQAQPLLRKSSLSLVQLTTQDESKHALSAIYNIACMIRSVLENSDTSRLLIDAATVCLDFLKSRDAPLSSQVSDMFKKLSGDLDLRGKCSDKLLSDIIECARPD